MTHSYVWHDASTRTQTRVKISSLSAILGTRYREGTKVSVVLWTCTHVLACTNYCTHKCLFVMLDTLPQGSTCMRPFDNADYESFRVCVRARVWGCTCCVCVCDEPTTVLVSTCTNYVYTSALTWTNYHAYMCRQVPTPLHTCIHMYHLLYTRVDKSQLGHTCVMRVG